MNTDIKDKLDVLIALSAKECGNDDVEMFKNLDTSGVELSDGFYAKQRRLINRYKRKPASALIRKCLVRAAVALMALMSVGFITVMAVPDIREAVFEAVVKWYDNYVAIRFEPNGGEKNEGTDQSSVSGITDEPDSSHPAITPPTKIEKVMKPTYIPEGAEEDVVKNNKFMVIIDYYLGDDLILSFTQTLYNGKDKLFDNKAKISYDVEVNGYNAVALEFESSDNAIIWTNGVYYYYVHSAIFDIDELKRIASSVR